MASGRQAESGLLATFTGRKLPLTEADVVVGFAPHVTSLSDYYPFGSGLKGRVVPSDYRYSFQGQETDAEYFNGAVSFKYRVHDARLGRFLSVDPLVIKFPFYSPYHFCGNKPISSVDLEGMEDIYFMDSFVENNGEAAYEVLVQTEVGAFLEWHFRLEHDVLAFKANQGWDIFISAKHMAANGTTEAVDMDQLVYMRVFRQRFGVEMSEETANTAVEFKELVLQALTDGAGPVFEYVKERIGEEVLLSEELRTSLENDRSIILISIDLSPMKIKDGFGDDPSGSRASTLGHEMGAHATNDSRGIMKTNAEEHKDFNGASLDRVGGIAAPGSPQAILDSQIQNREK